MTGNGLGNNCASAANVNIAAWHGAIVGIQVRQAPFSGKVILVPFFQPGLMSMVRISDIRSGRPATLCTVRLIFILRVLPLYSSSSVHGKLCSIGDSCRCCRCMPAQDIGALQPSAMHSKSMRHVRSEPRQPTCYPASCTAYFTF